MTISYQLDRKLGIFELRETFLEHTREAYALLPAFDTGSPRILDVGCGTGTPTMELARLSGGKVVGIDVDELALEVMRDRVAEAGLGDQVTALHGSIHETDFPDASFDLLWEEGVLHLLDTGRSLPQCRRLLKQGCYLVVHETNSWFDSVHDRLADFGFSLRQKHLLPKHYWLTAYAEPLDANLRAFAQSHDLEALDEVAAKAFATHQAAVASIRADPGATDCAFHLLQRTR
jgi:ubiquinone/menaquinone biosynthesis C-methylase UbiE